jgi:alanyl-tRNA synthetase
MQSALITAGGERILKKQRRMEMKVADSRMHSAEHILAGTLIRMLGTGRPFTTHLEKKKSKADFRFNRPLTAEENAEIEHRVNEVIKADLPVREEFLPRAEAAGQFDLSRLPDAVGEMVRIIRIGDYDACPCSGLHVASTREIGPFRLVSSSHENGALRVRFTLGDPQE